MTTENGGLDLASFDAIDEFAASMADGSAMDDDRCVHGEHPLVLFVEATIEAISSAQLGKTIVGCSEEAEADLRRKRRAFESAGERELLQLVLYELEQLCQLVRECGYGSTDTQDNHAFFGEHMVLLIDSIIDWATDEQHEELAERAKEASAVYVDVADDVAI